VGRLETTAVKPEPEIGDKFPKHVYHSIICIGALIASDRGSHWEVDALGAPHVGERSEKELITALVSSGKEVRQPRKGPGWR
jgi:3'-5' exonuclease